MSDIKELAKIAPVVAMLQHQKMSDDAIQKQVTRLNEQIELGAIWSLIKSRGDDPAALASLSPEQKQQYLDNFPAEQYQAALTTSAEHYLSDYIATIIDAAKPEDKEVLLGMVR